HRLTMSRRVLVVGAGGREHALAWCLRRDPLLERVIVAHGNPGLTDVASVARVSMDDPEALLALARTEGVDLVVVGPEAPLVAGLAGSPRDGGVPNRWPARGA